MINIENFVSRPLRTLNQAIALVSTGPVNTGTAAARPLSLNATEVGSPGLAESGVNPLLEAGEPPAVPVFASPVFAVAVILGPTWRRVV